ncbi:MAG: Sapep family Mn(2+)-dependent dipeptidase [Eubacteriales bacterium]|nr:Sapep family Mn(2+)-dependent dipeptidase [Eubacteriales bacterium]
MDAVWRARIADWYDKHRAEMIRDIMRLVSIESVATRDEPGCTYGRGCDEALKAYQQIAQEQGLTTCRYDDDCVSATYGDKEKTIGFWSHVDVVPAGNGWIFAPFEPIVRDGYLIGRGADDNKGPAVGMLYMQRCLKELGYPLRCGLKSFAGCDEEQGMSDLVHFRQHHACPDLSIIADCGFPVCFGEKGIVQAVLRTAVSGDVLRLHGGVAANMVPDRAEMTLRLTQRVREGLSRLPQEIELERADDRVTLRATGVSSHAAFPQGGVNAIHKLLCAALDAGLLSAEDTAALSLFRHANDSVDGAALGVAMADELSGPLTCVGSVLRMQEGAPTLELNIRYCVTAKAEPIRAALEKACAESGCALASFHDSAPNYFPREHPAVSALTAVYNEMTGEHAEPYVMAGGTYARKLPNAFGFGIGGMKREPCALFPAGHGGAHCPDEALHLDHYFQAMTIFTLGVIAADATL